jgi:hypothetical protein
MNYFKYAGTVFLTALPLFLRAINIPGGRLSEYAQNNAAPNAIPDIGTLVNMYNQGMLSDADYENLGKSQGFSPEWTHMFSESLKQYLTGYEYVTAYRRGVIDEQTLNERLQTLRVDAFERSILMKITEYFPTPADLVTFAVREVYSPDIVERFGQKQDLPDKFIEEAAKAGLNAEQATNYWAAHWDLPSISQGFEMFHRGVIEEKDLDTLLRALDVMPFWRESLKKIAYNPLTRVDVRRMYSVGVIDREGVKRSYLDIGYDEEKAELMT